MLVNAGFLGAVWEMTDALNLKLLVLAQQLATKRDAPWMMNATKCYRIKEDLLWGKNEAKETTDGTNEALWLAKL